MLLFRQNKKLKKPVPVRQLIIAIQGRASRARGERSRTVVPPCLLLDYCYNGLTRRGLQLARSCLATPLPEAPGRYPHRCLFG